MPVASSPEPNNPVSSAVPFSGCARVFTSISGQRMRIYVIGFMVGVIGLVAANQVRAGERCAGAFVGTASIDCVGASGVIVN